MRRLAPVLAIAVIAVVLARPGDGAPLPPAAPGAAAPALPSPALDIGAPAPLAPERGAARWAPVRRAVAARDRPGRSGRVVARVARETPEGTVTPLPVLGRRADARGRLWVRVALPVLPNGTAGWVPRRALGGYELARHRLLVDRGAQRVRLERRGRVVFSAPAGVGSPEYPTPAGRFIVRNRLARFAASPQYGPVAFGTSARARVTDWPGGGFVGIHGTDRPELIPGAISHGCIRLRNRDVRRLAALMPVGTAMVVR